MPNLKMHDLRSADTDSDAQHFWIGYPLAQSGVKAGARLLNETEVKSRRIGDCLNVVAIAKVGRRCGNCRVLTLVQTRDSLRKRRAEIGVFFAAVASPPTGIHTELFQICKPSGLLNAAHRRGRQLSKTTEVDWLLALGFQIGLQEGHVADLIVGIVGDVLRHVAIKL